MYIFAYIFVCVLVHISKCACVLCGCVCACECRSAIEDAFQMIHQLQCLNAQLVEKMFDALK